MTEYTYEIILNETMSDDEINHYKFVAIRELGKLLAEAMEDGDWQLFRLLEKEPPEHWREILQAHNETTLYAIDGPKFTHQYYLERGMVNIAIDPPSYVEAHPPIPSRELIVELLSRFWTMIDGFAFDTSRYDRNKERFNEWFS